MTTPDKEREIQAQAAAILAGWAKKWEETREKVDLVADVSVAARSSAKAWSRKMEAAGLDRPYYVSSKDGAVVLEWDDRTLEIEQFVIGPDGELDLSGAKTYQNL